ncbi:MAG TPA: hypothetical protein VHW66_19165 [Stellaceae bacterium]|nr:hypothetical protein [Stellaceae bacterium]
MSAFPLGAGVRRKDDRRWLDIGCIVGRLGRGCYRVLFEACGLADLHTSELRYLACRSEIAKTWRDLRAAQGLRP